MKRRSPASDRVTAFHEAGHAVVAYFMGRRFRHVTIIRKGTLVGHVRFWRLRPISRSALFLTPTRRLSLDAEISILLAGELAEARVTGRRNVRGSNGDWADVVRIASVAVDSEGEVAPYVAWRRAAAKRILSQFWPAVTGVAHALLEGRRLDFADVRAIVVESMGKATGGLSQPNRGTS